MRFDDVRGDGAAARIARRTEPEALGDEPAGLGIQAWYLARLDDATVADPPIDIDTVCQLEVTTAVRSAQFPRQVGPT